MLWYNQSFAQLCLLIRTVSLVSDVNHGPLVTAYDEIPKASLKNWEESRCQYITLVVSNERIKMCDYKERLCVVPGVSRSYNILLNAQRP